MFTAASPRYLINKLAEHAVRASPACRYFHQCQSKWRLLPTNYSNKMATIQRTLSTAAPEDNNNDGLEPFTVCRRKGLRNVAVIAHVDHGKTTLVDKLLQSAKKSFSEQETNDNFSRLMDSGDLEKERGITITSKVTRLDYLSNDQTLVINCVDTPGHADFAGEVDRVLSLVDGVLLVVDAKEGPMTQTKYVLSRALSMGLRPIVVLNKCDRSDAIAKIDSGETENRLMSLFEALNANDEQKDYTTLYASAREGWVTVDPMEALELTEQGFNGESQFSMKNVLDTIMNEVPEPKVRSFLMLEENESHDIQAFETDKFSLAAVTVGYDQYLGRTCTGRITSGSIANGDTVTILKRNKDSDSEIPPPVLVTGLFINKGISRTPLEDRAYAGDIVTIAGVPDSIAVGDTVTGGSNPVKQPINTLPLAPPTLSMDFGANNGPLAGKEGKIIASSKIHERLMAESDNNVTLKIEKSASDSEKTIVYARGELQLGILIEQMRREGFELLISPPRILTKQCPETGELLEPFEEVTVDVDSEYAGAVVSSLTGDRKGVLMEMSENAADGKARLIFEVPSRGLLGFTSEAATMTRGSAVVTHLFLEDRPHAGNLGFGLEKSKLVANSAGKATAHALGSLSARGTLFIAPGEEVYGGMVIGECSKPGVDVEVNAVRAKELSNMRTQSKDEKVYLAPPKQMTLEEMIGYMSQDEVIEVTPQSIRLRKVILDGSTRERAAREKAKQLRSAKK